MSFLLNGYDPFDHDGRFYFDADAGEKPLRFCEKYLTHTTGEFARQPLILHPEHANYIRALFGFKHVDTGLRRYRTTLYTAARGNAKTTLASLLAQFMTYCEGEGGAQTYLCASTRDQAGLLFDVVNQQIVQNKRLRGKLKPLPSRKRILHRPSNSYISAVASEASAAHGWNTYCAIADEVKNWEGQQGRDFWAAIETSLGKRLQPLLYITSTQAYERTGIWYDLYSFAKRVKSKPDTEYSFLPFIWELDEADDWTDIECIKKANPLWGLGVKPDFIARMLKKAQEVSNFENEFKREHCNILTEQCNRFISMADYEQCPRHDVDVSKEICVASLDTSSTTDLTAFAIYWPKSKVVRCWFWIPGKSQRQRSLLDGVNYTDWIRDPNCNLKITKSDRIDRQDIVNKVIELSKQYRIANVAYDPWEGKIGIADDLVRKGIRMVEWGQNYSHMNAPTKMFEQLIATHALNIGNNKCFDWNVSNLSVRELPGTDFIRPVKPDESFKRVDGAVAAIMAIGISKSISVAGIVG